MRALMLCVLITSLASAAEVEQSPKPAAVPVKAGTHPKAEAIRIARRAVEEAEQKFEDLSGHTPALTDGPEADDRTRPLAQAKTTLAQARAAYDAAVMTARETTVPGATAALARRSEVEKKIKEMQAEADANLVAVTLEGLSALPMAVVTLSDDPTRSEMQRADRAKSYNRLISQVQDRLKSKRSPVSASYLENILTDPDNLALFAEFSGR